MLPVLVLYFHADASVQTNVLSIPRDVTCRCPVYAWSDISPMSLHPRNPAIQIRLIHGPCHEQFKATIILPDTNSPERYEHCYPLLASRFYHLRMRSGNAFGRIYLSVCLFCRGSDF